MTEERFLIHFNCFKNKLNHVINLLQDRGIELEKEGENLLPNFPLKTALEFEQFEINLVESSEIQKRYVRKLFVIFYKRKIICYSLRYQYSSHYDVFIYISIDSRDKNDRRI